MAESWVKVKHPSGDLVEVKYADLNKALSEGFTLEAEEDRRSRVLQEEYGGTGSQIAAGALGAARGLSFGLSDFAAKEYGLDIPSQALKEANPMASAAGEVAGVAGGLLVPGSALGRVGKAVTAPVRGLAGAGTKIAGAAERAVLGSGGGLAKRALAKGAGLAAGGAMEGAAYGVGQAISEDALGNTDLTAESLLASAGLGAVVGAGAGALLGGAGTLVGAGASKLAQKAGDVIRKTDIPDALAKTADDQVLYTAFGQQKRAFDVVERKHKDVAAKYLREEIGIGKKVFSTKEAAKKIAEKRATLGDHLSETVMYLDDATEDALHRRLSAKTVADRLDEAASRYTGNEVDRGRVLRDWAKKARGMSDDVIATDIDRGISSEFDDVLSFADARKQRAAIQDMVNYNVEAKGVRKAHEEAARIWNDAIDDAATPVLDDIMKTLPEDSALKGALGEGYKGLRRKFALVSDLDAFANNRVTGNKALRFFSMSDHQMGQIGAITGSLEGGLGQATLTGLGLAAANKTYRKFGSAVAAEGLDRLSRLKMLQKTTKAVADSVDRSLDKVAGRAKGGVRRTAARATSEAVGIERTRVQKSAAPASVILMKHGLGDDKKKPKTKAEAVRKWSRELSSMMAEPMKFADRVSTSTAGAFDAAPRTATHVAATATKVVQHLHKHVPKAPQRLGELQPHIEDWAPSDQEVSKFSNRLRVAMQPMAALEDLAEGTLTPEGAETFRELYPQLFQMSRERLVAKLSDIQERLAYSDRINLSILFQIPVDPSMSPDYIRRSQQAYAQKPAKGQGGGGMRLTGLDNLNLSEDMQTATQKVEMNG